MKNLVLIAILSCLLFFAGCGAEGTAAGGGVLGGIALSNTIEGMKADLAKREQALIARYNELVAAGAQAETLEEIKQQIADTVHLREGVETTEHFLGVDWSDPAAAGGAIGILGTLAWSIFSKRKLSQKYVSMKAGQAQLKLTNPDAEKQLYALIGSERATRGL
jgi:hypothetical protein